MPFCLALVNLRHDRPINSVCIETIKRPPKKHKHVSVLALSETCSQTLSSTCVYARSCSTVVTAAMALQCSVSRQVAAEGVCTRRRWPPCILLYYKATQPLRQSVMLCKLFACPRILFTDGQPPASITPNDIHQPHHFVGGRKSTRCAAPHTQQKKTSLVFAFPTLLFTSRRCRRRRRRLIISL